MFVTVSIGAATVQPDPRLDSATLVATADLALYAAKAADRDRTVAAGQGEVLTRSVR